MVRKSSVLFVLGLSVGIGGLTVAADSGALTSADEPPPQLDVRRGPEATPPTEEEVGRLAENLKKNADTEALLSKAPFRLVDVLRWYKDGSTEQVGFVARVQFAEPVTYEGTFFGIPNGDPDATRVEFKLRLEGVTTLRVNFDERTGRVAMLVPEVPRGSEKTVVTLQPMPQQEPSGR